MGTLLTITLKILGREEANILNHLMVAIVILLSIYLLLTSLKLRIEAGKGKAFLSEESVYLIERTANLSQVSSKDEKNIIFFSLSCIIYAFCGIENVISLGVFLFAVLFAISQSDKAIEILSKSAIANAIAA